MGMEGGHTDRHPAASGTEYVCHQCQNMITACSYRDAVGHAPAAAPLDNFLGWN